MSPGINAGRAAAAGPPVVLTVAGSDSGGGAGIQADLKTFEALGVFGTSALTCVTAQNPGAVTGVEALSPALLTAQLRAVFAAFPVAAAKTGMLYSAPLIEAVADAQLPASVGAVVVDPVMVAASGARLLLPEAVAALRARLLPQARVVTPNVPEAELLSGERIANLDDLRRAAAVIAAGCGAACLAKGGHLPGGRVADVLVDGGREFVFEDARIEGAETHGAGCTFSAALAAWLARGAALPEAARRARVFVRRAMERALPAGPYRPLNFAAGAREEG